MPSIIRPTLNRGSLDWGQTCRHGGVSQGGYCSFNLAGHVGDSSSALEQNWIRFGESQHWNRDSLATCEQIHGDKILWVDQGGHHDVQADALVSATPEIGVGVYTADCVPVLIAWPEEQVAAAVHCGWRSTAAMIIQKTIEAVDTRTSAALHQALVYIGASIVQQHYQVGEDVVVACATALPSCTPSEVTRRFAKPDPLTADRWRYDVAGLVEAQLLAAGVLPQNIERSPHDTFADSARFYSYRRDGAATGRMLSFVGFH